MKKILIVVITAIFCLCIPFISFAKEKIAVKYVKTSDGDTARFMLNGENVRIRFLGINTPEVSGENKVEEPYGNEALAYTKSKLENAKKIEIEYDDVADNEDRFGRKLAWIWLDDELFELELLEQGLAKTYMLKNNYKYATELKASEKKAKDAKIGVWSNNEAVSDEVLKESSEETKEISNDISEQRIQHTTNNSDESFSVEWYAIVVMVIFIIILLLKKKSK